MSTRQTPHTKRKLSFRALLSWVPEVIARFEKHLNDNAIEKNIPPSTYVKRVFYVCLLTTLLAAGYHIYKYNVFEHQYNKHLISKFNTQLDETFHRYFSMLYGVRAVFSMSPHISLNQWRTYSHQILYPKRYPGIHGIFIVKPVYKNKLSDFLKNEQTMNQRTLKIISPKNNTLNELDIVQYSIEDNGQSSEGLNFRQYGNAKKALDKARDEDKSTMIYSAQFNAQNPNHFGPIFILYTPIYQTKSDPQDIISRRENFYGWVASSLSIKELFRDVLQSDPDFEKLKVGLSIEGLQDSYIALTPFAEDATAIYPQSITKTLASLRFKIHTAYLYNGFTLYGGKISIPSSLKTVLMITLFITLLATGFFWSILTMKQRALGLASRMTTDLFRQEQKYRALIQNAPGVIFSCISDRNWRMNYLSEQFQEITGYHPKEFLDHKRRYIEIIHPDDILKVEKTIGLQPKVNHEYFMDYRLIHKNGTVRWMHERAKVVRSPQTQELYLTGHFFDITEQKEKEADYRNLVNALENAVNGVAFINKKGYHLQVNEAYSNIISSTPQSLQYKSFFEFLNKKDQKALHHLLDHFDDKERDFLNVEATSLEDKKLYLYLVIVPAYSDEANKKITGFYIFVKDVSNEMRRENQLSEAVKAAESANQTKSTFLATMSHELRTPLNAIIGYSDMLLEDAIDDENEMLVGDLKKINNSGRHLLTLINDILDVSKLEAGKMTIHLETFPLKDTIQNMIDIIYPAAEQNKNTLKLNIPDDAGEMYSDLTKLRQMIFNLLSNACKFTKEGLVTVDIKPFTENNREFVSFSVTDSGIGITAEQMEKLFKPFVQADTSTTRNFGGTGLGLTITKKFSEILGGENHRN